MECIQSDAHGHGAISPVGLALQTLRNEIRRIPGTSYSYAVFTIEVPKPTNRPTCRSAKHDATTVPNISSKLWTSPQSSGKTSSTRVLG